MCQVLPNGSSRALNFRYDIEAEEVVNSFCPKQLPDSSNLLDLKPSHFGAAFLGRLDKLPRNTNVCPVYEAILCMYRSLLLLFWTLIPPTCCLLSFCFDSVAGEA